MFTNGLAPDRNDPKHQAGEWPTSGNDKDSKSEVRTDAEVRIVVQYRKNCCDRPCDEHTRS